MSSAHSHAAIEPVRKTIDVKCSVEHAFQTFTKQLGDWWPRATHSIGHADTVRVAMECREGGRLYEVLGNGEEITWGRILAWEPPTRLVYSWHLTRPADQASEVEIRFVKTADKATRVELEHRKFERMGEGAREIRDNYDKGWAVVFGETFRKALEGGA